MPQAQRNILNRPGFIYGTPDNLTTYTTSGSLGSVIAQDPLLSSSAYTLNATSNAAYGFKSFQPSSSASPIEVTCFVSGASTATASLHLYNTTTGQHQIAYYYFAAGVVTTGAGPQASGTVNIYAPVSVGNGWYCTRQTFPYVTASTTYQVQLYPAATGEGSCGFYVANCQLFAIPLYMADAYDMYRAGTEFYQSAAGVEDAWLLGIDNVLEGTLQNVPQLITDTPYPAHGYYGYNETPGVNGGLKAFLQYARARNLVYWCCDSANMPHTNVPSYWYAKSPGDMKLDEQGLREFTMQIRNPNNQPYLGY